MTRINCIPPSELCDQHLRAEYYELPRVFTHVRQNLAKGKDPASVKAPAEYTLGPGHVYFFYTRLGYLEQRMVALFEEMIERKMKPNMDIVTGLSSGIPDSLKGGWEPTEKAMAENRARIAERESQMKRKPKRPVLSHKD